MTPTGERARPHGAGTTARGGGSLLAWLALATVLAVAVGACSGTEERPDFTVTAGIAEPSAIDSVLVRESEGTQVARLLYTGLTRYDADLRVVPGVAERWEHDDLTTWTFTLREGTTFHNGEAVTAQSFVDAIDALASPDTASDVAYYGGIAGIAGFEEVLEGTATTVEGAAAPDDRTLVLTLEQPNALLPEILAHPAFSPRPPSAVADPEGNRDQPVGNGPYRMTGPWEGRDAIELVRFDGYFGEPGGPARIMFRVFTDLSTAYREVGSGGLDVAAVPLEQIANARAEFGDRFLEVATGALTFLGVPVNREGFDDPRLRQALSLAIDRQSLVAEVFAGSRTAADGFWPPLAPGGEPGLCGTCRYDPEEAQRLYTASGGLPGGTITILFLAGAGDDQWIEPIANEWERVLGLDADLREVASTNYLAELTGPGGPAGVYRYAWGWDYPHAVAFLAPLVVSTASDNFTGYANSEVDRLVRQATEQDATGSAAREATAAVAERLDADLPVIPVYFGRAQRVHSDRIGNVVLDAQSNLHLESVTLAP